MLTGLSIHNVVLIDRLDLAGEKGLSALTGETGAGKSILLDALGLALGSRADAGLVRHGSDSASVTATFDLPARHPARLMLAERDIAAPDDIILRRTLGKDGRSKAFVNDAPVTVQFMKELGQQLVEIHGQFETQGLLDPETHRATLDGAAGLEKDTQAVRSLWRNVASARAAVTQAAQEAQSLRAQEDYLRYALTELEKLNPQEGEEDVLSSKRQMLRAREKMQGAFDQAEALISNDGGITTQMDKLQVVINKIEAEAIDGLAAIAEQVTRIKSEVEDIGWQLGRLKSGGPKDGNDRLEDIEERYFALRELAKKHRTSVDTLPALQEDMTRKLRLITHQDDTIAELERAVKTAEGTYHAAAVKLSAARQKAAAKLSKAVNGELPDLKLDKARFDIAVTPAQGPDGYGPDGIDAVAFMVSTNPQTPPAPLHKIASGGELSRFMLALKVILAESGSVPTLIFDEADSGIGGATVDAVGERLQRLANQYQVLAVTHSPQVAARARHHWHVSKATSKETKGAVITRITPLATADARTDEIARMLSGAEITREARAQAARLLEKNAADAAA